MESDKKVEFDPAPSMDREEMKTEKEMMEGESIVQETADKKSKEACKAVVLAIEIPTIHEAHGPAVTHEVEVDEQVVAMEQVNQAKESVLTSDASKTVDISNAVATNAEKKETIIDIQASSSCYDVFVKAETANKREINNDFVSQQKELTKEVTAAEENRALVTESICNAAITTFAAENAVDADKKEITANIQELTEVTQSTAEQQNYDGECTANTLETAPMAVEDNVATTSSLQVSLMETNQSLLNATTATPTMAVENKNDAFSTSFLQSSSDTRMDTNGSTLQYTTDDLIETIKEAATTTSLVAAKTPAFSGLSLLAQYDTDSEDDDDVQRISDHDGDAIQGISDTESVEEVPTTTTREYRNRVVEIDSDSDSDSDSSEDEVEYLAEIRKAIDKSVDIDADAGDDDDFDENGIKTKRQPPRVKGEFLIDDLPPIQDLHITVPEAECVELGKVHSIVDQLVLVNALPDSVLLDLETVLFLEKGQRVLGEVFDVLGQVADPLYCVRFNSNKQIIEKNIKIGDVVFVAPKTQYTQFVILSSLMKMRGSDASWENDVEPPPRYIDYSDDEQERDARHRLRNRDRSVDYNDPTKRAREDLQADSPSPLPRNPFNQPAMRGRRGGLRAPTRYQHPAQEFQQRPPNYNPGSWHSNYPQHYAMPPPSFAVPPPQHIMYAPPPNFAAYPPHVVPMQPYQLSQPSQPYPAAQPNLQPPQHYPAPQPNLQQPPPTPMYVLNPYAVRPPVLAATSQPPAFYAAAPPPPPPGSQ